MITNVAYSSMPLWCRIACRAGFVLFFLHILLAIRIYFGLIEPVELTEMREQNKDFRYAWEDKVIWEETRGSKTELVRGQHLLMAGLHGRSWNNVVQIDLGCWGCDADLKLISERCPRLEILTLRGSDVSPESVSRLSSCKGLRVLDLSETITDDSTIARLSELKYLQVIKLQQTLVSDNSINVLASIRSLQAVDLSYTDVSESGLCLWRMMVPEITRPVLCSERDWFPDHIIGSIRWADGERSIRYEGAECEFSVMYDSQHPLADNAPKLVHKLETSALSRFDLIYPTSAFQKWECGTYVFRLKIGNDESNPVLVKRDRIGHVSASSIEFLMPISKPDTNGEPRSKPQNH